MIEYYINRTRTAMYKSHSVIHVEAEKKRNLLASLFFSSDPTYFIVSSESPIFREMIEALRKKDTYKMNENKFKKVNHGGESYFVEITLDYYENQKREKLMEAQKEEEEKKRREAEEIRKRKESTPQKTIAEAAKHTPSKRTTPTITMKEVDEQFHSSKRKMKTKIVNGIVSYFNGYDDLRRAKIFGTYDLVPLVPETILDDIEQIKSVQNDIQTAKCMPQLYGSECAQYFSAYLQNTYICTDMGIAFGYAIREIATMNPMEINYGPMIGFIKITSPSHNKMTNNFDGWLIDYLTLPKHRGKGLMKIAVNRVLDKLDSMGVEEVYAMVDNDNTPSLRILTANQFVQSRKPGGINPTTGKPFIILVHRFD